jgi:hypothetical protein
MDTREEGWNPESLSREFLATAEEAERYLSELRAKLQLTKSYEPIYDETLAKFYVFNYFHGRTFLQTRRSLLSALREFMAFNPEKPNDVFDFERFLAFRKNITQGLIRRFQETE